MQLTSPAFHDGGVIPDSFSRDAADRSPPLEISDVPYDTQSLALIMEDPDAPEKTFVHWVLFNIAPDTTKLNEAVTPIIMKTGVNDFGEDTYGGPKPPSGEHHYVFSLYALNTRLPLQKGATRDEVIGAMKGHVLETATLRGRFAAHAVSA